MGTEHALQWDCRGGGLGGGGGKRDYAKEMEAAVRVVQVACTLCQRVQDSLLLADPGLGSGSGSGGVHSKLDRSPVTVAGSILPLLLVVVFHTHHSSRVSNTKLTTRLVKLQL